ncbi:MAG: SH3 domain-containing protein [Anaerolineae bacterium]|nr:SH3 domain-containing protein [Anaerolineae bacterium]
MRYRLLGFFGLILLLSLASGLAAQVGVCETTIQSAITLLNENCASAGGNTACLGSAGSATFSGAEQPFSTAGDTVDLSSLQTLHTLPLDGEQSGLALMNVHANVPLAISEQGLKYVLLGDVEVENAVDAVNAFTPGAALTVTPLVAANLRTAPSTDAQVIVSAAVGTELSADGLSADGGWLRVLFENQVAWVSRQIVAAAEGNIDDLPVIGTDTRTFMQSFYLKMGGPDTECSQAVPPMLVIQSPGGVNANITANGAGIRFDSAIGLLVLPNKTMQLYVFAGGANVGGVSVPAGFMLNIPLTEDGREMGGLATGLRPINETERGFLSIVATNTAGEALHAPLTLPSPEAVAATIAQINGAAGAQVIAGPASGRADCSRFKPTSPLGSLVNGTTPFYWDAAAGATSYRVNVFGEDGGLRATFDVDAVTTTISADTGATVGGGSNFAWNVEALVDGQVACTSGRVSLPRDANPQVVGGGGGSAPQPTACTWGTC